MKTISPKFTKEQVISTTDLARTAKECLKKAHEHDLFVFTNNSPRAVIIDYDRYAALVNVLLDCLDIEEHREIAEIIESRKNEKRIKVSLEELEAL